MLASGIIIPEKTDLIMIHSLQEIERVEWNAFFSSCDEMLAKPKHATLFFSADILPLISESLVVLDPQYCRFDYLSGAIRNGCHLFLSDQLHLNVEERKELIRLAKEGGTIIQIKNDFLFQPFHQKIAAEKKGPCFIEIYHSQPLTKGDLKERLINNLLLVQMSAGVPVHRFDVFCPASPVGPSDILNIHIKYINGTTASVNLTFMEDKSIHNMKIYSGEGLNAIDLLKINDTNVTAEANGTNTMVKQIEAFLQHISNKSIPSFSLTDELEIHLFLKKIKEKIDLQSVVVI